MKNSIMEFTILNGNLKLTVTIKNRLQKICGQPLKAAVRCGGLPLASSSTALWNYGREKEKRMSQGYLGRAETWQDEACPKLHLSEEAVPSRQTW